MNMSASIPPSPRPIDSINRFLKFQTVDHPTVNDLVQGQWCSRDLADALIKSIEFFVPRWREAKQRMALHHRPAYQEVIDKWIAVLQDKDQLPNMKESSLRTLLVYSLQDGSFFSGMRGEYEQRREACIRMGIWDVFLSN